MKQIITRYALMGGAIVAAVLIGGALYCYNTGKFEGSMLLGFAAMLLAFSFIFVAVKKQRDQFNGGVISFGQAFKTGVIMALITSTIYVVTWLICYYLLVPDFMQQFSDYTMNKLKASGASAAEIASESATQAKYIEMYKNPFFVILFTYIEILPLGILVSLVAAFILKKKKQPEALAT
jgi:hypothetical protein